MTDLSPEQQVLVERVARVLHSLKYIPDDPWELKDCALSLLRAMGKDVVLRTTEEVKGRKYWRYIPLLPPEPEVNKS